MQRWSFEHTAGSHPHVIIRQHGSPLTLAEFAPRLTGGGIVTFATGERYCWNRAKIWSPRWCFRREGADSAVCVSQQAGPLTEGGKVGICCDAAARLPEVPVLILLAWYLRVLAFESLTGAIPGVG